MLEGEILPYKSSENIESRSWAVRTGSSSLQVQILMSDVHSRQSKNLENFISAPSLLSNLMVWKRAYYFLKRSNPRTSRTTRKTQDRSVIVTFRDLSLSPVEWSSSQKCPPKQERLTSSTIKEISCRYRGYRSKKISNENLHHSVIYTFPICFLLETKYFFTSFFSFHLSWRMTFFYLSHHIFSLIILTVPKHTVTKKDPCDS